MSPVGFDVCFFCGCVVPIHTCPCFDLLPLHTGNAGQLHGLPQDHFRCRWDIDTDWLAQVDWRNVETFDICSSAVTLSLNIHVCPPPVKIVLHFECMNKYWEVLFTFLNVLTSVFKLHMKKIML